MAQTHVSCSVDVGDAAHVGENIEKTDRRLTTYIDVAVRACEANPALNEPGGGCARPPRRVLGEEPGA